MTVVAWDGKILAADKLMTGNGLRQTTTKLFYDGGTAIAFCGNIDSGMALVNWYKNGAIQSDWPVSQRGENWAQALIIKEGKCYGLSQEPFLYTIEDNFAAIGSGRDYAIAAMHLGKNAKEAVEVASLYDVNCGNGVDVWQAIC